MNHKEGMFGRIMQKGKAITGAIALSTVIAGVDKVEAQQMKTPISAAEQSRQETVQKTEALNLFKVAMDAQAMQGLTDDFEIARSKKRVAEIKLQVFALRLKQGFPEGEKQPNSDIVVVTTNGVTYPEDIFKATKILKPYLVDFLDNKIGNGDGVITLEEREKLKTFLDEFPGLKYLFDTIQGTK